MANGIMDINSKQTQPTINQPGPNVTPNATMATSGVSPIIGGLDTKVAPTKFPVGADFFERMQDIKDMSDNQILVGMQQGAITPMEGLIEMQTRKEARSRYQQQRIAEQAGKKSVVEQVTDEFVASGNTNQGQQGIMDTTALAQASSPVKAYENGGIVKYNNRGIVGGQFKNPQEELEYLTNQFNMLQNMKSDSPTTGNMMDALATRIQELSNQMQTGEVVAPKSDDLMSTGIPKEYLYYDTKARDYAQSRGADETTRNTFAGMLAAETGKDIDVITGDRVGSVGEIGAFQLRPEYFGEGKSPGFGASGDLSMDAMKNFDQNAAQAFDYYTGIRENLKESFPDLNIDFNRAAVAAYNAGPNKIKALLEDKKENYEQFLPEGTQNHLKKVFGEVPPAATQKLTKEELQNKIKQSGGDPNRVGQGVDQATLDALLISKDQKNEDFVKQQKFERLSDSQKQDDVNPELESEGLQDNIYLRDRSEGSGYVDQTDLSDTSRTTGIKVVNPEELAKKEEYTTKDAKNIQDNVDATNNTDLLAAAENKVNTEGGDGKTKDPYKETLAAAKDIAKEVYGGEGVQLAVDSLKKTIDSVFKSQEEFNKFENTDRLLRAAGIMYTARDVPSGIIDSLGVLSDSRRRVLENDQKVNENILKLNSTMASIITGDEKIKGKMVGDLFTSITSAKSEAAKSKLEERKLNQELVIKETELIAELAKDPTIQQQFDTVTEGFDDFIKQNGVTFEGKKFQYNPNDPRHKAAIGELKNRMKSNFIKSVLNQDPEGFTASMRELFATGDQPQSSSWLENFINGAKSLFSSAYSYAEEQYKKMPKVLPEDDKLEELIRSSRR